MRYLVLTLARMVQIVLHISQLHAQWMVLQRANELSRHVDIYLIAMECHLYLCLSITISWIILFELG